MSEVKQNDHNKPEAHLQFFKVFFITFFCVLFRGSIWRMSEVKQNNHNIPVADLQCNDYLSLCAVSGLCLVDE